ncbi:MAG: RluA family pseudouridine synthase [Planctomycetia bacterium]|nr:RluA family pseudouridine synthase [Planctomycetia bacterium]
MNYTVKNNILYEDNHLLVLNKVPQIATMGLPEGETTLLTLAKDYIKQKYHKEGNVYLGVVSRLDFPVSGVVVFARTSKAAERLNAQFRTHEVQKTYLAIVEGLIHPLEDLCVNTLCEDPRHRKMYITELPAEQVPGAVEARLRYRRLARLGENSLLEVALETGRKHQIRLQLAHRGHPIAGDFKYGSRLKLRDGIALHARSLVIKHPTRDDLLTFTADVPPFWHELGFRDSNSISSQ